MSDEEKSLMDLPSPILLQILSSLPPTTLLHVKTLSKSYLNLTLDSEFVKLSRSASPASIIINQFNSFWINSLKLLRFVVDNNLDHDPHVELHLRLPFQIDLFFFVGSVHGFVCFNSFARDADSIYILNPTTREFIVLPQPQRERNWPNFVSYSFGFDPVRFEYKVVRISQEEIYDFDNTNYYKSKCQVYTIGKGSNWRNAGHVMFFFKSYGVNLYAKIHWFVYDAKGNELICSFNLENELFESFPTAPGYNKGNSPNRRSLGVFGRCLCVCDNNADTHFEVWVMKEYRVTDSWVKQVVITITPEYNDWLCDKMIKLVKVFDDGELLFLWSEDFLFLHHPVKKTLKKLDVCTGNILASAHVSSSFSLKSFEGEVVYVF